MAYRKQISMVMRDESYVDRRIKIFQVKKSGPKFDVKKIAADLKMKTLSQVRQTKSDLISMIRTKTTSIPVKPVIRPKIPPPPTPQIPMECTTIIDLDSSEEEVCGIKTICDQ